MNDTVTSHTWPQRLTALGYGVLWTGYCLVGSAIKERRFVKYFGKAFKAYQARVPFWIPVLKPRADRDVPIPTAVGKRDADVIVAGGGPVGLLLAGLLGRRGLEVLVVERRHRIPEASMAIGITPPSLAILKELGLDQTFTQHGVTIDTARVFEAGDCLGKVDFSRLPTDHRYILSLPQAMTLKLLQAHLATIPNVRLVTGVDVVDHADERDGVRIELQDRETGARSTARAAYLAGCDGHHSTVRRLAGIGMRTRGYRPRFIMADFEDRTTLHREAHLYFGPHGSIESFPLPGGRRRWIAMAGTIPREPDGIGAEVVRRVRERTPFDLGSSPRHFASDFRPVRALARRYTRGHIVLCGDAAHVMSPIGGQGMNTGFADAAHLARALVDVIRDPQCRQPVLAAYNRTRRRAFRVAADRAARGMWMGTRTGMILSRVRRLIVTRVLMHASIKDKLAPYFAMLTIPGNEKLGPDLRAEGRAS